jgi:metal-responsive CopG/Arc/MetJ family transcriptional regulator
MKKIEGNVKRVSIIFTEDIVKFFDDLCQETGASFSELTRRALVYYMEQHKNKLKS